MLMDFRLLVDDGVLDEAVDLGIDGDDLLHLVQLQFLDDVLSRRLRHYGLCRQCVVGAELVPHSGLPLFEVRELVSLPARNSS